jgi:predicted DNA-binding transcriptional regulator AlpA
MRRIIRTHTFLASANTASPTMFIFEDSHFSCVHSRSYEGTFPNFGGDAFLSGLGPGNMMSESPSQLMIAAEIALWLRMKCSTIYSWAAGGKIPCVKINGAIRFIRSDIEHWIVDRSNSPNSPPLLTRPIIMPKPTAVSCQTIKRAGARAMRQITGRQSSQQNSASEPLRRTTNLGARKDTP